MMVLKLTGVALVLGLSGVTAEADSFPVDSDMAGISGVRVVVDGSGQKIGVVGNANECAPFESRAVWGGDKLLGYHCYHNPNR